MAKKGKKANIKNRPFEISQWENASKTLLANIRFSGFDDEIRAICVTSSIPNEGKTAIACNLCVALASSGKKTLLIENDMRRRTIAAMLGVHPRSGIYALMNGKANIGDAVLPTHIPNLYFLDSEPNIPNPPALLGSLRYESLIQHLRGQFDYVIIDTPPVTTFPDAAIVSQIVDGTVFVVRQKFSKKQEIRTSLSQLKQANANILGTALTFCDSDESDYYYYSYYRKNDKNADDGSTIAEIDGGKVQNLDNSLESWERRMGIAPSGLSGDKPAAKAAPKAAHGRVSSNIPSPAVRRR